MEGKKVSEVRIGAMEQTLNHSYKDFSCLYLTIV